MRKFFSVKLSSSPHLAELRLRVHLQPVRDPHRRRNLFPLGIQAPALDGICGHGTQFGLGRGLVADAEGLQEADARQVGDGRVPEGHGGAERGLGPRRHLRPSRNRHRRIHESDKPKFNVKVSRN